MNISKCRILSLFSLLALAACSDKVTPVQVSWDDLKAAAESAVAENPQASAEIRAIAEALRTELDGAEHATIQANNREIIEGKDNLKHGRTTGFFAVLLKARLEQSEREVNEAYEAAFARLGFFPLMRASNEIELLRDGREYLFKATGYEFTLKQTGYRDADLYLDLPVRVAQLWGRRAEWLVLPTNEPTSALKNPIGLKVAIVGNLGTNFYKVISQEASFREAAASYLRAELPSAFPTPRGPVERDARTVTVPSVHRPLSL